MKTLSQITRSHSLFALGFFLASSHSAFCEPKLTIKSALPESESKAKILDSIQVFKVEGTKASGAEWKGTGALKIGEWESLVLVKDQQGVEIERDPKDETHYTVKLTLLGEDTSFEVVRVLADGKSQTLFLEFSYPEWTDPNPEKKNLQLEPAKTVVSLGPTSFVYQEQGTQNFSSIVLTLKASNRLELIPKKLDLGTNFFVSLFPLTKSDPERTARFFGLNLRLGRAVWEKPGQKISIHLGVYYTTMLTSVSGAASPFGFSDLMGPQLYPTYSRSFEFGVLSAYFKFSPVGRGVTVAPIDSRELAFGLSWVRPHKKEYNLVFSVDYSNFRTQLPLGTALQEITNNSLSFAGGIEF